MYCQSYAFSSHAIKRMFERGLSRDDVVASIEQGNQGLRRKKYELCYL